MALADTLAGCDVAITIAGLRVAGGRIFTYVPRYVAFDSTHSTRLTKALELITQCKWLHTGMFACCNVASLFFRFPAKMTMTEEQEIAAKIGDLGEQIKAAKAEKKPKEEWEPILKEMLTLKVS